MKRYLLGTATPVEQAALEDNFAADPQVFEQLVAVENELADQYARQQLSTSERTAFESHVLAHPQRRARAQFAAALASKIDQERAVAIAPAAPWQPFVNWWRNANFTFGFSLGLATAALLLAFFGWQLLSETRRLRGELGQLRAANNADAQRANELQQQLAQQQQQNQQLNAEMQRLREAAPNVPATAAPSFARPSSVSLLLTAGLVRDGAGGDTPRLVIPRDTAEVRLRLKNSTDGYARYRLSLQTATGSAIRNVTVRQANLLSLNLPASLLTSGEYVLALSGLNANGEADALSKTIFIVEKK